MDDKSTKNALDFANTCNNDDEINRYLFNLSDDSNLQTQRLNLKENLSSSLSSKLLTRQSNSQVSTPHEFAKSLYSSPNSSPIPQPLAPPAYLTSLGFPLRTKILRTISSSNAISYNSNESGISSSSSNYSLVKKSSSSSIYSSNNNLIYRNLSSPSEYCDSSSSGNEAHDYAKDTKLKRLSNNLINDLKAEEQATPDVANLNPESSSNSRRQSWGSYSQINQMNLNKIARSSLCSCNKSSHTRHLRVTHSNSAKLNRTSHLHASLRATSSNSMLFNLNRVIFNRNFVKRQQQKQTLSSPTTTNISLASSTNSCSNSVKKTTKKEGLDSSCLLRIKSNKLGSSTPNLAFGICSLDLKSQNLSLCSEHHHQVSTSDAKHVAPHAQSKSCKYCMKSSLHPYHSSTSLCSSSHSSSSQFTTLSPLNTKPTSLNSPTTIKQSADLSSPSILMRANKRLNLDSDPSRRWSFNGNFDSVNSNCSLTSNTNSYDISSGYESLPPISSEPQTQSAPKYDENGTFLVPPLPPPPAQPLPPVPQFDRPRMYSSSNESQLDDSISNENNLLKADSVKSPNLNNSYCIKQRSARSCSPLSLKYNSESDMVLLQNEKFKEKFPKACHQMEENLMKFIETNKDLNQIDYFREPHEPAARFIHNQIIELANWCLEKSCQNQLSCAYFDEMTNSLEKLLVEAAEKCVNVDTSVESLRKIVKKFLLIVSRVARLLECLEFDPEEFCHLLNAAEAQARNVFINYNDIPKYIISKLGLNKRDPFDEFTASLNAETCAHSLLNLDEHSSISNSLNSRIIDNFKQQRDGPKENDFEKIKLISNGAYGAVYLVRYNRRGSLEANDEIYNKRFAMKEIKKQDLILRNQLKQVFTERDIMIFTDNPFVVALICTFETKKHLCMVMEYVEGGDVATLIKNMGPLTLDMAKIYFAEATLAVEYLHNYGIIHRDLKPDNLLITSLGHIKLTDFGLSKVGLMNLTTNFYEGVVMRDHYCKEFNDKQICGTPQYLAPEVILRQSYGKAVDWWSMGIILYEFLTSVAPYNGASPDELFDNVIDGEIEWPGPDDVLKIPDEAKDIINGLLTHDPMHRLGADGAIEIKKHVFFHGLDWDNLLRTKAQFVPELEGPDDTSYFDTRSDRYNHDEDEDSNLKGNSSDETNLDTTQTSNLNRIVEMKSNTSLPIQISNLDDSINYVNTPDTTKQSKRANSYDTDTDSELFASFSSYSSRFKLCSNENSVSNSPVLQQQQQQQQQQPAPYYQVDLTETRQKLEDVIEKMSLNEDKIADDFSIKMSLKDQDLKSSEVKTPIIQSPLKKQDTSEFNLEENKNKPNESSSQLNKSYHSVLANDPVNDTQSKSTKKTDSTETSLSKSSTSTRVRAAKRVESRPKSQLINPTCLFNNTTNNNNNNINNNKSYSKSNMGKQNRFNRLVHNTSQTSYDSPINHMVSLALSKPEIIMQRGIRGYGFTLRSIPVYDNGNSYFYTIQHIVIQVDEQGPAYSAGLRVNDVITHVNDRVVCAMPHNEMAKLILSSANNMLRLRTVNRNKTHIKNNGRKRSVSKMKQAQAVSSVYNDTNLANVFMPVSSNHNYFSSLSPYALNQSPFNYNSQYTSMRTASNLNNSFTTGVSSNTYNRRSINEYSLPLQTTQHQHQHQQPGERKKKTLLRKLSEKRAYKYDLPVPTSMFPNHQQYVSSNDLRTSDKKPDWNSCPPDLNTTPVIMDSFNGQQHYLNQKLNSLAGKPFDESSYLFANANSFNSSSSSTSTASNSPHYALTTNERFKRLNNNRPRSMIILHNSNSPTFNSTIGCTKNEPKQAQSQQSTLQTRQDHKETQQIQHQQQHQQQQQQQQSSRSSKTSNKSSNSFFTRFINRLNTNKSNNQQQHQNPSPLAKCDNLK